MECRGCHQETGDEVLVDLGLQPMANSLVNAKNTSEPVYPLAPVICKNGHCGLVQIEGHAEFGQSYPYRSGQSAGWIAHLGYLVATVMPRGVVIDVGGNDGSLAQCLPPGCTYINIDPISTQGWRGFLTKRLGESVGFRGIADWVVANNVVAHVDDLDDFLAGVHALLAPTGLLTVEVQDLEQLIRRGEWDCIYHEHFTYFTRYTLADVLERRGFFVERIEDIPTHGGSLRAYARKHDSSTVPLRRKMKLPDWPITDPLMRQMILLREWTGHRRVVGYGAPAKATTFLNRYRLDSSNIECIMDSTPEKIGKFTPGSHIPIVAPNLAWLASSDIVVILAWNWKDEILPKIPAGPEVWCRGERLR